MDYESFRRQYEQQHPGSLPARPEIISEYAPWVKILTGAMFLSAAMLSGVHTAPTVRLSIEAQVDPAIANLAAGASFAAIELAIFVSAYLRHKNRWLAYTILSASFIVAVSANIVSVAKALGQNGETGAGIVAVILGFAIPIITLAAGEMFVHITSSARAENAQAEADYLEASKAFDRTVNQAWARWQKDADKRQARLSTPTDRQTDSGGRLSEQTDRQTDNGQTGGLSAFPQTDRQTDGQTGRQTDARAGYGYNRTSDGQTRVMQYLSDYPDEAALPLRQLAARIGVNKDTVSAGRKLWQAEFSANGHAEAVE